MKKQSYDSNIVLWAIDPFETVKPTSADVTKLLAWLAECHKSVQPVYILKVEFTEHTGGEQIQYAVNELAKAEQALQTYLEKIGRVTTLSPKALLTYDSSTTAPVTRLTGYASEISASMIIVSSRGQHGLNRLLLGSFAETLLLHSKVPLYFLPHLGDETASIRTGTVLFATDFSAHARQAFEMLLGQLSCTEKDLIVYNAIFLPLSVVCGDGLITIPESYCAQQEDDAKCEAQKWVETARSFGVEAKAYVQSVGVETNIATSIIGMAKDKSAEFIAMASNSGRVGSAVFGSVVRQVFRANVFPVWVCGPNSISKEIDKYDDLTLAQT